MRIGNTVLDIKHHTYVMGILNVTPDSFSDGGKYNEVDRALAQAQRMVRDGAAILDIGGESTRPGYIRISDEEEIERVAPVIAAIKARMDIPVSIDTYKPAVARAALQAGADLVNDIWGFRDDERMAALTAQYGAACCLMHNRKEAVYGAYLQDVADDLTESVRVARAAGVSDDKIILDPGIGFAKTLEQNLLLTGHLEVLTALGFPVLLGTSRKSMIGKVLDLPFGEREEGTLVTTVLAVQKRCAFVRVHDVLKNVRAIKMTEAILEAERSR